MPPPATTTAPPSRPPRPEPGAALPMLCASAAHRLELAAIECEEAQEHALLSLLLAGAAFALALLAGFALTLLIASQVWADPHRGWWLGGLAAAYLAAALVAGRRLARRLRDWQPFDSIRRELQQDYRCLRDQLQSAGR